MSKIRAFLYTCLVMCSFGAHAVTQNITATGTVSTVCAFTSNQAGTLAVSPTATNVIYASNTTGGTPAGFGISYIGTPTIIIDPVTAFDTEPAASSSLSKNFIMEASSTNIGTLTTGTGGVLEGTESAGATDNFVVQLGASYASGTAVPMGNYAISTTVTCQ